MDLSRQISFTVGDDFEFWTQKAVLSFLKSVKSKSYGERALSRHVTLDDLGKRLENVPLKKFQMHLFFGAKKLGPWRSLVQFRVGKDMFMVFVRVNNSVITFTVLSDGLHSDDLKNVLLALFDDLVRKNTIPEGVWADFSQGSDQGPNLYSQFLKVPFWKDIVENYSADTASKLENLSKLQKPWERGKLIILSGPPGTGKTFYLRALMNEWKAIFKFIAVSDPERFAADPSYYFNLAARNKDGARILELEEEEEEGGPEQDTPKRTLFIMEDAADLVISESRAIHYDKISKLLNITDGLFGQGREDAFLISFNEDITDIDPAFLRPGRCMASIRIDPFTPDEAKVWLTKRGKGDLELRKKDYTLAELYKMIYDQKPAEEVKTAVPKKVGF